MSVHASWRVAGEIWALCHVYSGEPPILTVGDGAGVSVSVTSHSQDWVSARHAASAREFAEQVRRYAEECARWVPPRPPERVIAAVVCGACGSDRLDDGPGGGLCCVECGEVSSFTEVYADNEAPGEGASG
ncbi:MAG: hypothetical protein ACRDRW_20370 [Pseudonocardiaceae bacterium]